MPTTATARGVRVLFLDDDPTRAVAFLASNPEAVWVQDAHDCIERLDEAWDEVHLDHDLGGRRFVDIESEDCGMEVVRWLCREPRPHLSDSRFVVHSRNINAACVMVLHLQVAGYSATAKPFDSRAVEADRPSPSPRNQPGDPVQKAPLIQFAGEAVAIALACLAPWAFGSVDAWARLGLWFLVAVLAALGLASGRLPGGRRSLLCAPSLALGGLALLALLQALPWPERVLGAVEPRVESLRASLSAPAPQGVLGDEGGAVPPPASTPSIEPEESASAAIMLLGAWVLLQAILGLRAGSGSFRRLALAMSANATLLALFAVVQALTWGGKIYGVRPSPIIGGWYSGGPFICHNHLAASLNLGLGCALGLLLSGGRSRRGTALLPAYMVGVILVGILASHSRGGFVATVAATLALLAIVRPSGRTRAALAGSALLVAIALAVVGGGSSMGRLATIWDASLQGFNGREEIWRASLPAWRLSPWIGTGLGSFAVAASPFLKLDRGVFFSHAENEYLQILVEGGVAGLILGLLGLVGVARLGWVTLTSTQEPGDRALFAGGLFGLVALAVASLGDFPLHIPGVAFPAVVLLGSLIRPAVLAQGVAAETARRPAGWPVLLARTCVSGAIVGLVVVGVWRASILARAEAAVLAAGLPHPGSASPTGEVGLIGEDSLLRRQAALEEAIRLRPGWTEGHLRLGETRLALYRTRAAEWLGESVPDAGMAEALSDPLWLHGLVHAGTSVEEGGLLGLEPIRDHLVPAARSFLEARRRGPLQPIAHVRLGTLDYLLSPVEPAHVHIDRALRLAGADARVADVAARVAAQSGDRERAALCWKRAVDAGLDDARWEEVAEAAGEVLTPDRLNWVLESSGRDTLRFALRLFGGDADREQRERFLRDAVTRLRSDRRLGPSERLWHEGEALAYLGESEQARGAMRQALEADPRREYWRAEYVGWLIRWGESEEAYRQARRALALAPDSPAARQALRDANDARFGRSTPPGAE